MINDFENFEITPLSEIKKNKPVDEKIIGNFILQEKKPYNE